jgi:NAD+ synthase (glutamine-hydrolysing)
MVDFRDLGIVRTGYISPIVHLGDPMGNAVEHEKLFRKQALTNHVMRCIGPELGLTGYSIKDLIQQEVLLDDVLVALKWLIETTADLNMLMSVGAPLRHKGSLYNCAITFIHGKILAVNIKIYRPNYREFEEGRHVRKPSRRTIELKINLFGQTVPFTPYVILNSTKYPWFRTHVSVCEDDWVPAPVGTFAALAGSTHQDNLSASNITVGKSAYRHGLIQHLSSTRVSSMTYSAASGDGESSADTTWDGDCIIACNGEEMAHSDRFALGGQIGFADVDLKLIEAERMRLTSFGENAEDSSEMINFIEVEYDDKLGSEDEGAYSKLAGKIDPMPFVPKDPRSLDERCYEVANIQVMALIQRLKSLPEDMRQIFIGVSGGLDSARALQVAVEAFDRLGISRKKIHAFTMPGFGTTDRTYNNAIKLINGLGVSFYEVPIRSLAVHLLYQADFAMTSDRLKLVPALHKMLQSLNAIVWGEEADTEEDKRIAKLVMDAVFDDELLSAILPINANVTFENGQAWPRMMTLFINSAARKGLVLGTGDLTEALLGWCTLYADHAAHYNINVGVPKSLIKYLIVWSARKQFMENQDVREAFEDIAETPISPELLFARGNEIMQKTEDVLGPLVIHDFMGYWMIRNGVSPEKAAHLAFNAFEGHDFGLNEGDNRTNAQVIKDTLHIFIVRFFANQFKRECVPDGPKVGLLSLSPRGDWRMPPDASNKSWIASWQKIAA